MSFGIGLGAFVQGIGQGITLGRSINQVRQEAEQREAAQGAYRQSEKEREVAIGNRMAGDGAPAEGAAPLGITPPPGGTAPVAPVQQQALPPIGSETPSSIQGTMDGLRRQVAARDPAVERVAGDLERNGMPLEAAPAPRPVTAAAPSSGGLGIMPAAAAPAAGGASQTAPAASVGAGGQGITPPLTPQAAAATAGLPVLPRGPVSREQAEREVGSIFDFYVQRGAPRVVEQMLAAGNVDGARQFQNWIRGERVQQGMRDWAGLIRAAQTGDDEGVLRFAQRAYNNPDYSPDGQTVSAGRVVRGENGGVNGLELTIQGRDGRETTQRFNGTADLYRQAVTFLAPEQQFQFYMQSLGRAEAAEGQARQHSRNRADQVANTVLTHRLGMARDEANDARLRARGAEQAAATGRREDQRLATQQENEIERIRLRASLEAAQKLATGTGERVQDLQQRLESIRNNMVSAGQIPATMPMEEQIARATAVLRQQRGAAGSVIAPPATTLRPTPVSPPRAPAAPTP